MEKKYNILLAEDDVNLGKVLTAYLEAKDYVVSHANNGEVAYDMFCSSDFDICLIDVMMPIKDGFSLAKSIRKMDKKIPIIFLTAKDMQEDIIEGLSIGGDDYITKPFDIQELLARVQIQLRHAGRQENKNCLSKDDLELDRTNFQVKVCGTVIDKFTKREFAILELLLRNPERVFSKEEMFEYAWEEPYVGETKTLDVHISNIRKKLKNVTDTEYIETVWGIGYRLKK